MSSFNSLVTTAKHKIILSTAKKGKQNINKNKLIHVDKKVSTCHVAKSHIPGNCQVFSGKLQSSIQWQQPSKTLRFQRTGENYYDNTQYFSVDSSPKWSIGDFEILQQLGHGKFGQVYAARQLQSDFIVALKKMSRSELAQNSFQKQIKREVIIQSSLKHEHILKMFGYFWDEDAIYLILEYAPGGQLYGLLKRQKRISQKNASVIIRQVLQALKYLHQNHIIHRDIKPENLLVSLGSVKLADFGWSIHSNKRRDTLCGTLDYLAPEMVKGSTHDSSIDIWQVGILTYQLVVGCPPFQTNSYDETYQKIVNSDVVFPQFTSFQLRKFVRKCLQKRPQKRLKVDGCLIQEFILNCANQELQFDD